MKRIDCHIHVGGDMINEIDMLDIMKKSNIDMGIIMTVDESSNIEAQRIVKKYPEHFRYFATVNDAKDIQNQKNMGALGLGEMVINKAFDDPKMYEIFSEAQRLNMPIIFHISTQIGKYYGVYDNIRLPLLEKALNDFKDLIFIGHSQAFWFEIEQNDGVDNPEKRNEYPKGKIKKEGRVSQLLRKYPNLYCDLSANSGSNALMRDYDFSIKFINEFHERLIFGTDTYEKDQYFPLKDYLDKLLEDGRITKIQYENIFYNNILKVLKKEEF